MVIGEIIQELIQAHEKQRDVDLNRMKSRISSKYGLDTSPRLVDIIAAVPIDAKHFLLPKLRAKPIRSASGVSVVAVMCKPHRCPHIKYIQNIPLVAIFYHFIIAATIFVSALYLNDLQHDRQYLRLLSRRTGQ